MDDRSAPVPSDVRSSTASPDRAGGRGDMPPCPTMEHERIARDLGDTLVHQLFAASLDLAAVLARIDDRSAAEKVLHAMNGLDQAIKNLRRTVFESRTCHQRCAACSLWPDPMP